MELAVNRRQFLATGAAVTGAAFLPGCVTDESKERKKMNILFILLDDLGKEWISCYGAKDVKTPNIDALAEGGVRFENVYSMPQCTPSRMCLLTGQYPYRNGWVNHWDVPRWGAGTRYDVKSFPCNLGITMRNAGYATAIAGKWQVNDFRIEPECLDKAGFDDWCMWTGGEGGNRPSNERYWDPYIFTREKPSQTYQGAFGPDMFCDFVIDFARKRNSEGKPFFIYYPMVLTHTPFTTTPLEPNAKTNVDKHKAMVRYSDHLLGRIVEALEEMGAREETLIIFTSDNGTCPQMVGHIGERAIPGGKAKTIEPGVNIPFIANWPGTIPAGRVSDELTDFTDVIPTMCDLTGQPVPGQDKVDGVSIAPYLRGETKRINRDWILAMGGQNHAKVSDKGVENEWYFRDRVVRDKRYKLYVGTDRKPVKFIDLDSDPEERNDITGHESDAALKSRERFEALIPSWPESDADFVCENPQPPQEWDNPVKVKSQRWKKGRPGGVLLVVAMLGFARMVSAGTDASWVIDAAEEWKEASAGSEGMVFEDGTVAPAGDTASYKSVVHRFDKPRSMESITFAQSPVWLNWEPIENLGPSNLRDAPVLLVMGPDDYWIFGRYGSHRKKKGVEMPVSEEAFEAQPAKLEGFDIPLETTPYPEQYNAPGGLEPGLGGYHAWQSRDMKNWVHHGPVTEKFSCWVTTAEQVDGKVYIYYDYPNDQDPHLYIDEDLTDGKPGKNMGLAFKDPSDGSDCGFIRDLDGNFHVIYENWSPINASKHSWDSPLAGHAVSKDGIKDFKILAPAVDERTRPTGRYAEYRHPHWHSEDPDHFPAKEGSNYAYGKYEIHEPEQNAYGDWAPICIGGQYYLFCDYHPANDKIRVGWFTSPDINKQFSFCGELGMGHPDPDIAFAEGRFYLITQINTDHVSPGPWVEEVAARVGADTDNDGKADTWTEWQQVSEKYDYIKGFSKQVKRIPAAIDLKELPECFGVCFEFRVKDTTENASKPVMDRVTVSFKQPRKESK